MRGAQPNSKVSSSSKHKGNDITVVEKSEVEKETKTNCGAGGWYWDLDCWKQEEEAAENDNIKAFSIQVDESDEEGRSGLIHATLQGKVRLFSTLFWKTRLPKLFRRLKGTFRQENMVEVLLDGSADIEVGHLFSYFTKHLKNIWTNKLIWRSACGWKLRVDALLANLTEAIHLDFVPIKTALSWF